MDPATQALAELASHGVLGALVVVLGVAYTRLQKQVQEIMQARVDDAQKVATTLMDLQEKWMQRVDALTTAIEGLRRR
jgi:hypothetical protein